MHYYKITISLKAKKDLNEILEYIAQDNRQNAIIFIDEIKLNINKNLGFFPHKYQRDKKFNIYTYKNYLIIYKINDEKKSVEILKITHSKRYNKYKHLLTI